MKKQTLALLVLTVVTLSTSALQAENVRSKPQMPPLPPGLVADENGKITAVPKINNSSRASNPPSRTESQENGAVIKEAAGAQASVKPKVEIEKKTSDQEKNIPAVDASASK